MSVKITARHCEIDAATRERIEAKVDKLQRNFEVTRDVAVTVTQEKLLHRVEVSLFGDGVRVAGKDTNEDLNAAIERVFEKVERQVRRYKTRGVDSRRRAAGLKSVPVTHTVYRREPEEEEEEIAEDPKVVGHEIDKEEHVLLSMSPEDAAVHLDLSGDQFFVFLNIENHHINVIYHREDGHCGLIEPVVAPD